MKRSHKPMNWLIPSALALGAGIVLAQNGNQTMMSGNFAGHLYAMTNAARGNAIVHYGRGADGKLKRLEITPTGGNGVGGKFVPDLKKEAVDPLFSNDSLVLSADHHLLFAVNAGSGTVSSFTVDSAGSVKLVGHVPSGGDQPTGLSFNGSVLYVGHAKANKSGVQLTGFKVSSAGVLSAIRGAAYSMSGKTLVTQVLFSPNGKLLEVSELMTGHVDLFPVNDDGTLGTPVLNPSAVSGPFGAAWVDDATLLVSEVHPGQKNKGSVSSYKVDPSGSITPITPNVTNNQNATCWLTLTPDGQYLYASNTASSNVSVYTVSDGALTLLKGNAASRAPQGTFDFMGNPASGPVDAVSSQDGKFFYQQFSGLGLIAAYRIAADGNLTALVGGDGTGLPKLGAEGLAGY